KLVVGTRIGVAKIIDGIDDATAHHVEPDPVGHGSSEEGIVGLGKPVGKHSAGICSGGDVGDRAAHEFGRHHLAGSWLDHFAAPVEIDELGAVNYLRTCTGFNGVLLLLHAGEEGCGAVIVILGPALEGVV